jgi:hypothetical protein
MTSSRRSVGCILLVILIGLSSYALVVKAEQVDIRSETERYRKEITDKKDYGDICKELKSYGEYIAKTLKILNAQFTGNRRLYKKVEKYGTFKNNRVTLSGIGDREVQEYKTYLDNNGIKLRYSEGNIFLHFDPLHIVKNFRGLLPNEILEYYATEAEDINEGFEEDGALIIPWDGLRKKIIRYEKCFNAIHNKNCPYIIELAKQKIRQYLNAYLAGIDNTRIYDEIEEAKNSYENFLVNDKNSRFYGIIKDYYAVLKRNSFKFGQKEEIKEGRTYVFWTILTKENEEVPIGVLVDRYLKQTDLLLRPR